MPKSTRPPANPAGSGAGWVPAAERKANERARKRKLGLVLLQAWVHPEDRSRIKAYLAELAAAGPQSKPPKRGRPKRSKQGTEVE